MMEFTQFIDNNFIVFWLRESTSIFAYPTLVAFDSFGLVLLVGITTGVSLRTFGFASKLPLAPSDRFSISSGSASGSALSLGVS
jgi:hypothetical protein